MTSPHIPVPGDLPPRGHGLLLTLTVVAVVFLLDWARTVFIPIVLGVLISHALSPLVDHLQRWKIPRALGAAVLLLLIVGGGGSLAYSLNDEASGMIETLPQAAQKFRETLRREWGRSDGAIGKVQKAADQLERAASETAPPPHLASKGVTRVQIEQPTFNLRDYVWHGTMGALSFISLAVMVLFLVYFLLISGDSFRRKLVKLSGPSISQKKITLQMLNEIHSQIQRYLLVQVLASVLVGVATWLAFLWIGMDHAAVWGVTAAVFNAIPYLGALIITGATALVALVQFENVAMALTVIGVSLVIHGLIGYLLTPWLTGRANRMDPVVVFVSVLFWGWLWGGAGLLLGMPIMIAVKSVCDHVEELHSIGEFLGD